MALRRLLSPGLKALQHLACLHSKPVVASTPGLVVGSAAEM
jgi:hypothetical protein